MSWDQDFDDLDGYDPLNNSFSAEPVATFDLTPASGSDGSMVFNLTPVKDDPGPLMSPPAPVSYDINNVYNRQLSNTISAMTFPHPAPPAPVSPVVQSTPITPDFTGLLPPPPPVQTQVRHVPHRPPPPLLSVSTQQQQQVVPNMVAVSSPQQQLMLSPQHPSQQQVVQVLQQQRAPSIPSQQQIPQQEHLQQQQQQYIQRQQQQQFTQRQPQQQQLQNTIQQQQQRVVFSPKQHQAPPPPYKSPPYSQVSPQDHSQLSPASLQMSPHVSSLQIAPNVTLTKKQKPVEQPQQHSPAKQHQHNSSSYHDTSSQDDSIISPPPPPYKPPSSSSSTLASPSSSKLPSYSLEELKDLPGANLKKSTVDLNLYIAAIVKNTHPHFQNVDSFAERCLACIVRKIKSNLPTLRALMDSSLAWQDSSTDPGCVLIPRMKDGRITIARPGAGAGGTKKIHPHLALVQIYKLPQVTNHNSLVSVENCVAPFMLRPGDSETGEEMVCINPMHYNMVENKMKSPATPRRKTQLQGFTVDQLNSSQLLLSQMKQSSEGEKHKKDYPSLIKSRAAPSVSKRQSHSVESDQDLLSDSDDDGVDWVKRWTEERVVVNNSQVQEFNVNELAQNIKIMSVETDQNGKDYLKEADSETVKKYKIVEDFSDLLNGKYDLKPVKNLHKVKPKKSENKPVVRKKPGPKPKKKVGETWISGSGGASVVSSKVKQAVNQVVTTRLEHRVNINQEDDMKQENIEPEPETNQEDKEEAVIQNLLEDIKGSFENQFDMDLDSFGAGGDESSDFSMTTPFNLSSLDVLSKESFDDGSVLNKNLPGPSSDAMFGGREDSSLNFDDWSQTRPVPSSSSSGGAVAAGGGVNTELTLGEQSLMDDLSSLVNDDHDDSAVFFNQTATTTTAAAIDQHQSSNNSDQGFTDSLNQEQFFTFFDEN